MGFARALFALSFASALAAAPVAPTAEPTFADLERILFDPTGRLVERSLVDGHTLPEPRLDPLLDALGHDLPCGTPIGQAAARVLRSADGSKVPDLSALLEGPRLATSRTLSVAETGLVIEADVSVASRHHVSARDANRDGDTDALARLVDGARAAATAVEEALGWRPRQPVRVVLAATPFADGRLVGETIVIPTWRDELATAGALAHQLAHLALADLEPRLPSSIAEALATSVADRATSTLSKDGARSTAGPAPGFARRALLSPGLLSSRRDGAFLDFAAGQAGLPSSWAGELVADASRRIDAARAGGHADDTHAAKDAVLASLDEALARRGTTLADAVAAWHRLGLRDALTMAGTEVAVDARLPPVAEAVVRGAELPPFGALRFALDVPERGGLDITLEGDERAEGEVLALLSGGGVTVFPLAPDAEGHRRLRLPTGRLLAAVALVQAPTIPDDLAAWSADATGAAPGDFILSVSNDATFPFEIDRLGGRVAPDQVTVEWATTSETDVAGWIVERAERPGGPWRRLTPLAMPSFATTDEPGAYALVDHGVEPDRLYHYRVRALTRSGMSELGPTTSVRTLPAGPRRRVGARAPEHPASPSRRTD